MKRIKVINEPTELVSMLRCMDTEIKRQVFEEVAKDWCTEKGIEEKFGQEGVDSLHFFEKMRLVEIMWQSGEGNRQEKAYHSYYNSFHINTTCGVAEITDVLFAAVMPDEEFKAIEEKIVEMVGDEGKFAGDVEESIEIRPILLKGLIKRSALLEYRGHRIEKIKG